MLQDVDEVPKNCQDFEIFIQIIARAAQIFEELEAEMAAERAARTQEDEGGPAARASDENR